MVRPLLPAALAVLVLATAPAQAEAPFEVRTLDNGLTVLLAPSHAHPVVAAHLFVTTGGRTEDEYYQGSLHYIEHLVFKGGTPNLTPTEFRKKMSLLGQEDGGWTWDDEINFGFQVPKENFPEAIETFREGLMDLQFEEEWFEAEKKVVFQEMERGFERPGRLIYNFWDELAFNVHPYGRPVIGSEKAVHDLEMNKTYGYYEERFTPNHMILSLAGDFEVEEMVATLERVWGHHEPGPDSFDLGLDEPEQKGPRWREDFLTQATSATCLTGVVTAGAPDADTPALMMLAALLNDTNLGLPQYLEEQEKWVTAASAGHYAMRDAGTFRLYLRSEPEKMGSVRDFAQDFLFAFDATEVPSEVFEETRRAMLAGEARSRESYADLASRLGFLASRRGVEGAARYVEALEAVTPEEVQAAKERWIRPRKLVTVTVYPDDFDPMTMSTDVVSPKEPVLADTPDLDGPGGLHPAPGDPLAYERTGEVDGVTSYRFANGMELLVRSTDASDILGISGRVMGGQWIEPVRHAGINRFVSELGMRATRRWDRAGFDRWTSAHAIQASAHISVGSRANTSRQQDHRDSAAHHVAGLADQADVLLATLKETLFFPSFDAAEVEKLRVDLLDEIKQLPENNLEYIKQEFYCRAYEGHPYGRHTLGSAETISLITADDLQAFHTRYWTPDRTVIGVVGDVDPDEIADWIASRWADLPTASAGPLTATPPDGWNPPREIETLDLGKDQWTVNWGRPGVPYASDRFTTSQVLSAMAGNDHFYKYVYEEGVSYRSWIRYWPNRGAGTWIVENDVQRERFDETLGKFEEDLARYSGDGFAEKEFEDAIQRLVNGTVLGAQDNAVMAWRLTQAVGNGADPSLVTAAVDRFRGVAYDDVQALAREVFDPEGIYRLVQK